MDETLHATLARWADFYLITGTAAAALTGLQFVVQTLLTSDALQHVAGRDPEGGVDAFGSPTVVHFTLALVVSAVMCVPWTGERALQVTLALTGVAALGYLAVVLRRAQRQKSYVPVVEDWLFHAVLPTVAYAAIVACALLLARSLEASLFAAAGATLLLLCIGIHNAWDTVTYLTVSAIRTNAGAAAVGASAPPAPPAPQQRKNANRQRRRR